MQSKRAATSGSAVPTGWGIFTGLQAGMAMQYRLEVQRIYVYSMYICITHVDHTSHVYNPNMFVYV